MPFVSERQRRFLWANKPEVAQKFADIEKRAKKNLVRRPGPRSPRIRLNRRQRN